MPLAPRIVHEERGDRLAAAGDRACTTRCGGSRRGPGPGRIRGCPPHSRSHASGRAERARAEAGYRGRSRRTTPARAAGTGGRCSSLRSRPEGKRAMSAREFLAGRPLEAGSRPRDCSAARGPPSTSSCAVSRRTRRSSRRRGAGPRRACRRAGPRARSARSRSGPRAWQAALDHVLAAIVEPTARTPRSRDRRSCGLSAYQLLYLDRVPASAVVDDACAL